MIHIRELQLWDLLILLPQLRPDEVEQCEALSGEKFDHQKLAVRHFTAPGMAWTIADEDEPILSLGGMRTRPGVLSSWYIPSPKIWTRQYIRTATKVTRTLIRNVLAEGSTHRIETVVLSSRTEAQRWYHTIGLKYESTMRSFGSNGEDAAMFVALREKVD
jgi:hypothetical protein